MLEKIKKKTINILVKLRIIEYRNDKSRTDLPRIYYILGSTISITIIQTVFNFHNHRFFSLNTLYGIILILVLLYPVMFVLNVINRIIEPIIEPIKKYMNKF
jgi:hypothetical protein